MTKTVDRDRKRRSERGAFIVVGVLVMTTLMIAVGLVIDVGMARSDSRRAQNAADAAALAAVMKLPTSSTAAVNEGIRVATLNGFTTGGDTVVSVSNPPTSGAKSGNSAYVQVVISGQRTTGLSRVVSRNTINYSVSATAKRRNATHNYGPCVFCVLSRKSSISTWNQVGTKNVYVQNGAIAVRSLANPAVDISGNAEVEVTVSVAGLTPIFATRGKHRTGGSTDVSPAITDDFPDFDDPLAGLTLPTPVTGTATVNGPTTISNCTVTNTSPPNVSCSSTATIPAGKYGTISMANSNFTLTMAAGSVVSGQISVSNNGTLVINGPVSALGGVRSTGGALVLGHGTYGGSKSIDSSGGNITLSPGIHTYTSDWDITGGGSITGSNVLLYFTCQASGGGYRACNANGTTTDGDAVGEVGAGIKMAGGNPTTISGRTSADTTYGGMFLIYDRNNTSQIGIMGNNAVSAPFSGTLYAKMGNLVTPGGVDASLPYSSAVIIGTYAPAGNGTLRINFDQSLNKNVDLVTVGTTGAILEE